MNIDKISCFNQSFMQNIRPIQKVQSYFKCDTESMADKFIKTVDIGSTDAFPEGILSNFTESHFTLDGKKINSMEGFLQALKTPDVKQQEDICQLVGYQAKKIGHKLKKKGIYTPGTAYWNGKSYERGSKEFSDLLKRAYNAKYDADAEFRTALQATKGSKLVHSIGKNEIMETILTEKEFVDILTELRDKNYQKRIKFFMQDLLKKLHL